MIARRPLAALIVIAIAIAAGVSGGPRVAPAGGTRTEDARAAACGSERASSERARKAGAHRRAAAASHARPELALTRHDLDLDHARPWTVVATAPRDDHQADAARPRPRSRAPPRT